MPPSRYRGDGADELFGGYRNIKASLRRTPGTDYRHFKTLTQTIINALPHSHTHKLTEKFRQLQRFIHGAEHDAYHRHAAWMEVASYAHDIQLILDKNKHMRNWSTCCAVSNAQWHGQFITHIIARHAHRSNFRHAGENRPHIYAGWD